jgi:hypothetical protein
MISVPLPLSQGRISLFQLLITSIIQERVKRFLRDGLVMTGADGLQIRHTGPITEVTFA